MEWEQEAPQMDEKTRRAFLKQGVAAAALTIGGSVGVGALLRRLHMDPVTDGYYYKSAMLRPPGAIAEENFLTTCIQCFQCAEVCDRKAIRFPGAEAGKGIDTPFIIPVEKGCDLCMRCSEVCPSGALLKIEKEDVKMGEARIDDRLCLPWIDRGFCGACTTICPNNAITAGFRNRPEVDKKKCLGCGLCEEVCVQEAKAIRVYRV